MLKGRQSRTKDPKLITLSTSKIPEPVHTDISRPFKVKSLGKAINFLVFIDDNQQNENVRHLDTSSF
jgi:hypothetical protein